MTGEPRTKESGARAELLEAAIRRIAKAPVYEKRGVPASGISLVMIRAIREACEVVDGERSELSDLDACIHDFGMLGVCVKCGASERHP